MSFELVQQTYELMPKLREAVDEVRDGGGSVEKHHPGWGPVQSVAVFLAFRCRQRSEPEKLASLGPIVDDALAQIAEATGWAQGTVGDALRVLERVEAWVAVSRGNKHRSTIRAPGAFFTAGLPAVKNGSSARDPQAYSAGSTGLQRGASRASNKNSRNSPGGGDDGGLVGRAAQLVSKVDAHPELVAVMTELTRRHGAESVDEALAELEHDRYIVAWPSQLSDELDHRAMSATPFTSIEFEINDPDLEPGPPVARPRSA